MPLAGHDDGLERVGQVVDVEHLDALDLRHLVEVVVGGDDDALDLLGQPDELGVDLGDVREVPLDDAHVAVGLLQRVHRVEAAPAPGPPARVGGVGDGLQLLQHEAGDDQVALDETGGHHVAHAPVDDHRGVEDLGPDELLGARLLQQALEPEQAGDVGVALVAQVGEQVAADGEEQRQEVEAHDGQVLDGQAAQAGDGQPDEEPDGAEDEPAGRDQRSTPGRAAAPAG